MKKSTTNLIGILTLMPAIYTLIFLFFTFTNQYELTFVPPFITFVILHAIMTILSLILLVVYLMHLLNRQWQNQNQKILWLVLLVFTGMATAPIYFALYMRNDNINLNL